MLMVSHSNRTVTKTIINKTPGRRHDVVRGRARELQDWEALLGMYWLGDSLSLTSRNDLLCAYATTFKEKFEY